MLVKLGNIWADPTRIVSINKLDKCIPNLELEVVSRVVTIEDELLCEGAPDDLALIVNYALQSQSYGGEVEKEATP